MATHSLTLRSELNRRLTTTEMDDNFRYLEDLALSSTPSSGGSQATILSGGSTTYSLITYDFNVSLISSLKVNDVDAFSASLTEYTDFFSPSTVSGVLTGQLTSSTTTTDDGMGGVNSYTNIAVANGIYLYQNQLGTGVVSVPIVTPFTYDHGTISTNNELIENVSLTRSYTKKNYNFRFTDNSGASPSQILYTHRFNSDDVFSSANLEYKYKIDDPLGTPSTSFTYSESISGK